MGTWNLEAVKLGVFRDTDFSQQVLFTRFGEKTDAFSYAWIATRQDGSVVVIDTGFRPGIGDEFDLRLDGDPGAAFEAALGQRGMKREDVRDVVVTHLHFDHVGGAALFPHAAFHLQRSELAWAAAPEYEAYYDRRDVAYFVDPLWSRLRLLDGDTELWPGFRALWTGGHTPGHQSLLVDTDEGRVALTGDVCNFYENLDVRSPNLVDVPQAIRAVRRFRREADVIVPGHDPRVMERHPRIGGRET